MSNHLLSGIYSAYASASVYSLVPPPAGAKDAIGLSGADIAMGVTIAVIVLAAIAIIVLARKKRRDK